MEMVDGVLYSVPQFPQLSGVSNLPGLECHIPTVPSPGATLSSKSHLVPQCLMLGGFPIVFPVEFLKQLLQLTGPSVPGVGTEQVGPRGGLEGAARQLLCSLIPLFSWLNDPQG